MLGQDAVLDPHHVGGHPCGRSSGARQATVDDDVVALCQNEVVLIAQAVGKAADKPEQAFGWIWALCWMYLSDQYRSAAS
jgi:hypothetical protein